MFKGLVNAMESQAATLLSEEGTSSDAKSILGQIRTIVASGRARIMGTTASLNAGTHTPIIGQVGRVVDGVRYVNLAQGELITALKWSKGGSALTNHLSEVIAGNKASTVTVNGGAVYGYKIPYSMFGFEEESAPADEVY